MTVRYIRKRRAMTTFTVSWWRSVASTKADDGITSKYKRKLVPANVLRHFPIKSKLQSYSYLKK